MGQKQSVHHEIEIDRSPQEVRAVLLDFASYPKWQDEWTYELLDPKVAPIELKPGDKVELNFKGSVMYPFIVANSHDSFQIAGSFGVVKGHHMMFFKPGKKAGSTLAIIHEDFTGIGAFVFRKGTETRKGLDESYKTFIASLKRRVEGTHS